MIRLSQCVIVVGVAVMLSACGDVSSTAPAAVRSSSPAGNVSIAAAPLPQGSCTIAPNGAQYDVTVAWSDLSVTSIELRQTNVSQPLVQAVLGHPTRKGSMTFTTSSIPDYALVAGRQSGFTTRCLSLV
jgi:hypothetical protein